MNTPYFSIIVVSFQAGEKLPETLESILEQKFEDYEVIIKDAGSTDGSLEKIPADPRIRLICREDAGIYDGMNQAVRSAWGEYLYFLNCGDTLHDPEVLENVSRMIRSSGERGIWYGDVVEMQTGQVVAANPQMTHFAMFRYLPCHQACFYAREAFSERMFDTQYRVRADYEHFLWCVIRAGLPCTHMPIVIADYEGGGFSESEKGRTFSAQEHKKITGIYFTKKELFLYRLYLLVTLQPLRERLAQGKYTAAVYDRIKNAVYKRKRS